MHETLILLDIITDIYFLQWMWTAWLDCLYIYTIAIKWLSSLQKLWVYQWKRQIRCYEGITWFFPHTLASRFALFSQSHFSIRNCIDKTAGKHLNFSLEPLKTEISYWDIHVFPSFLCSFWTSVWLNHYFPEIQLAPLAPTFFCWQSTANIQALHSHRFSDIILTR